MDASFAITDNDNVVMPRVTLTLEEIDSELALSIYSSSSSSSSNSNSNSSSSITGSVEALYISYSSWLAAVGARMNSTDANSTITTQQPKLSGNGTGELVLTNVLPVEATQLLQSVVYMHHDANPGNPTPGARGLAVAVWDGLVETRANGTVAVEVEAVNDEPFFASSFFGTGAIGTVRFVEEAEEGSLLLASNNSIVDIFFST